jgi:hypothetical protein
VETNAGKEFIRVIACVNDGRFCVFSIALMVKLGWKRSNNNKIK